MRLQRNMSGRRLSLHFGHFPGKRTPQAKTAPNAASDQHIQQGVQDHAKWRMGHATPRFAGAGGKLRKQIPLEIT